MRSSSFLLNVSLLVAAADATSAPHRRRRGVGYVTGSPRPAIAIPRGGSDGSSSSSAPGDDFLGSLLSGMNLPGMGGPGGLSDILNQPPPGPEQIQQTMEQMMSLLSSPQVREMMNDPAKMEASLEAMRKSILSALNEMENGDNVMVRMMLEQMKGQVGQSFPGGWDGLRELIEDPDKWRMMMGGMIDAMKSLGEEDIGNIMAQISSMGGGMGGMMPGTGGSTLGDAFGDDHSGTLAGLDDLSEDD